MNIETTTKIGLSLIPTAYFIWTDQFTGACIVLFLLIILDTLAGVISACRRKEFCSSILKDRAVLKSSNYLIYLIAGYLVHMFIISIETSGWVTGLFYNLLGDLVDCTFIGFVGFLIIGELLSILENLSIMGCPLPQRIIEKISTNEKNISNRKRND